MWLWIVWIMDMWIMGIVWSVDIVVGIMYI